MKTFIKRLGNVIDRVLRARSIKTGTFSPRDIRKLVEAKEIVRGYPDPSWKRELFINYKLDAQALYPQESFCVDVDDEICQRDVVLLEGKIDEGEMSVAVKIIHDYYNEKQQHNFKAEILWMSRRTERFDQFSIWSVQGRELYPLAKKRQAWENPKGRSKVLEEKRCRGVVARLEREKKRINNEVKEMWDMLHKGIGLHGIELEEEWLEPKDNQLIHHRHLPLPPSWSDDQVCYLHCMHCSSLLDVTVPVNSLYKSMIVRCGQCWSILEMKISIKTSTSPSANTIWDGQVSKGRSKFRRN